MKKLVFVLSLMIFGSMSLMAQTEKAAKSCSSKKTACCASKAKAAGTASADTKVLSMAESLAASDENITKRVCAESGTASYYKKEVCSKSGKISYNEVEFDETKNQFVNKSPNDIGDANEGKLIKVANKEAAVPAAMQVEGGKSAKKSCAKTCTKEEMKKCSKGVKSTEENN